MLKVYYLKVSDFVDWPNALFLPFVGKDTQEAIVNYSNDRVVRTKLLGESMIRRLLFVNYGLAPEEYDILKGEHGKPYVSGVNPPVFYNLSHSGDYIVGVIGDREAGIDIEQRGKMRMEVAKRFFHPNEIVRLEAFEGEQQTNLFFRYWSVKESYLKYTGEGLSASLSGFEVNFEKDRIGIVKENIPENVYIRECDIDKNYNCFICSRVEEIPRILSVYDLRSTIFDLR